MKEKIENEKTKSQRTGFDAQPSIDGPGVKCDRVQPDSFGEKQLIYFASLPKVRTRIPREAKEPIDAVHTVIVNDLRINIRKGVNVELPTDVVDMIEKAFYDTDQAIDNAKTRNPFTGKESNARIDMKTAAEQQQL